MMVAFKWDYDHVSSAIRRFVVGGGSGTAFFSPSSDGWKTDKLELNFSKKPAPLSREERKLEEKDTEEQQAFQKRLEEEKREKKRKYWALLKDSKTPSQDLSEYHFQFTIVDSATSMKRAYDFTSKISDVDIKVDGVEQTGNTELPYQYTIWFNDIQSISLVFDPERNLHMIQIKSKYGKRLVWGAKEKDYIQEAYQTLQSAHANWKGKYSELADTKTP